MANISPCFTDFNNEKIRVTEIYINFAACIDQLCYVTAF